MLDLIILTRATEKLGFAIQDGKLIEMAIDRPDAPQLVGSIFLGKVITVDQGLQAAFVDIGQSQLAYLEKNQIPDAKKDRSKSIASFLYEGQSIVVQVIKDAYQEKGARLTMNVTIASQMLVYLPYGNYLAVSKKLSREKGKRLKMELKEVCQDEEGLIIRTQATDYSTDELISQIERSREMWQRILSIKKQKKAPRILSLDHPITDRFVRRFSFNKINQIVCDQAITAKQVKARYPELESVTNWVQQSDKHLPVSLEQLIQQLLNPVVECDQGVSIVIDQTEAMTVIDVNSSGFTGKINRHHFAYKVNRIAADRIAEQIRLRNLSGMIVIDFLRMKEKKHQQKIIDQLKIAFESDPTRTEIYGFTKLGLFEVTRKRESPMHHLTFADSHVQKIGLSQESMVYKLERELISSQDQAIVVEVTKGFRQVWDQWIEPDHLSENASAEIYFIETKGVKDYHIKRSGTDQLISDYFSRNNQQNIDRIN